MVTQNQRPSVVFQPTTIQELQRGIQLLTDAIKPTLGPIPRSVAFEAMPRHHSPEFLDKGALIARRITSLPNSNADMGAMLLRQMLWQQYETVGDGTATAAILFQSIFDAGTKYIVAGGNAMRLRTFLLQGLALIKEALLARRTYLSETTMLKLMTERLCQDKRLAEILSEIFEVLGEYGQIDIRSGRSRDIEREYVQGVYWASGVPSMELLRTTGTSKVTLENCAIFASDLVLDDPRDLIPLIEATMQRSRALVIIASQISERIVGFLTHINRNPEHFQATAIQLPKDKVASWEMLEEIALMTGARIYLQVTRDAPQYVQARDLGSAKLVWANADFFCIAEDIDGGNKRAQYLVNLQQQYQLAPTLQQKMHLQRRIGHLMGASATLFVGGTTPSEVDQRKTQITEVIATLRSCLGQGIVEGGGMAYLNCQTALKQHVKRVKDTDERVAYNILIQALTVPARQILHNAGANNAILGKIQQLPLGYGYDVIQRQYQDLRQAGIVDAVGVVIAAIEYAVTTAALALTIDVLIHHRQPSFSATP